MVAPTSDSWVRNIHRYRIIHVSYIGSLYSTISMGTSDHLRRTGQENKSLGWSEIWAGAKFYLRRKKIFHSSSILKVKPEDDLFTVIIIHGSSLTLSLSLACMHTHTLSHTRTHSPTHTLSHSPSYALEVKGAGAQCLSANECKRGCFQASLPARVCVRVRERVCSSGWWRERERAVRVAFGLGFDKKECKINGRSWVCAALMFMEWWVKEKVSKKKT